MQVESQYIFYNEILDMSSKQFLCEQFPVFKGDDRNINKEC